ncbi:MAG: hypothetical protein RSF02_00210 [Bacilli bacterium]
MNEKKSLVFTVIAVATFATAIVGATFAYFTAQAGAGASSNVNITTKTTDSLTFNAGTAINIIATQANFASGLGNLEGSTTAKASLRANNGNNSASYTYNLYLDIASNNFAYTVNANTPELLLTITDPSNQPLTTVTGLTYKTVGSASGFDITNKTGKILLVSDYNIASTTALTEQTWTVKVTFINLSSDQQGNTNKTFNSTLKIQKDKY